MGKLFNSFLTKVTKSNLLSHFKYLFVLIILFSGMLSYEVEAADPPSVRVLKGSAISPASAISVLGSTTTHTNSTEAPRHQEIIDLASSLKNDPDLIFEYVYDNVETLPTFGLKNGALGAIIDGKGTAFDQAHLMVEMLRAAGYTAQYRYGTVTLTGSQFTNLFGTTNDRNACELMQAGGFGVTVNGSTNCSALSTSSSGGVVSFNHVWVRALIGSTYYYFDPSVKTQTRISGWNMSSKTGYNSSAFWTDAGVSTGVQGNASYVSNINRTNIETDLTNYSNTLVNNMKAEVNHNTSVTDIAGGIEVEPVTVPSGGYRKTETQLGHVLVANQSWSGDMPDQYRTKVDISYSGTTTSFYADDLYGRRLWFYNPVGYTARFMVGKRIRISAIWNGATSISVSINHPYAAMSGTLGDHTEIFNSPFQKGKTAALVLGFGHTGKGLRGRYQNFNYQGLTEPTGGVFPAETAESNAQLSIGASLLSQASLIRQLNDGVNDVYSVSHDTVGLVFDDDTVASTVEPVLDIRTQISLTDPSHNATYRTAAIQSYTSALSMIETAVLDQVGNTSSATPNAVGVTTLFAEANDAGQKFYQVTSSSVWYSVKPYLTGYSSTEETDILGFLNAGHTLILPQNGSLTKGNYTGVAYQSFKSDTSFGHNLDDSVITNTSHLKGGLLAPVETSFIEEELNLAGPGGGSSYGSDLQINPAAAGAKTGSTDLVVGSGPYPFSLSFTRSFRPDTNDGTTGGWTHNFAITGKRTSDGSLALGDRYAIDAARAMVALYVGREVLKGGHTVERTVTSALIQNWLHKGLYNNIFKVSQGSDAIEFVALADGSYYAPEGQAASFTLSGTGSSTTATYTSKSGAAMTLTATDSTARDFRVTEQAWPSGMNVTMTYPTATRMVVANGLGRSLTIDMSADGKLITKVTDETNRYVDYTYAGLNISDAIMHQSPTGSSQSLMKYSYSGDLLTGTTPPVATTATTSFTHNALGQLTSITQTDRGTTNIYANHWRTEVVDPSGAKQITKNDPYGRWVKVIDDNGNESTTYFDRLGRVKKSVAPEGNFVEYNYDRYHNVQSVSQNPKPASGLSAKTTSFTYEGAAKFRQVKTVTDPSNQTATYTYFSTTGLLSSVTAPAASVNGGSSQSAVTSFTYNGNGQPLTMTNPNNIVTKFTYTTKGEVLKTIANDGGLALKTDYEYYAIGDLKKIIDNRGKITNFVYDYLRRRTSVTAPHGIQTDFIYDANGRLYQSKSWINSAWHINTRAYDAQGRVTQVTDNANKVTTISYDDINRAVTVTDPSLRKVKSIHNGLGQKVEVVSGLTSASEVHEFITYNANGTVATLKDGKSNLTSYTYDGFDRLVTTVFPGGLTSTVNSFDANSRPTSVTSRGGDTVTTAYDALGRTLSRTVPGVGTYSYQYDKNSQVTKVLKGTEAISYTYDTLGRVIKEVDGYGRQMEYAYYDSTGKWDVKYNFPGAESNYWLRYATDDVGRLTTIREYDATTLATYAYDTGSRVTSVTMGNGAVESFTYDTAGRLSTLTQNFAGTADDATWTYGHNDSGQVTSKTVSNSAYEWTPTFNSSTAYVTNTLNQYTAIGGINQSHDSNGNLTSDGSMTFVFNALNQMTEAKSSGVTIGSYEYDPLGRRKAKTASGLTTQYLWGGSQIMAEYNGTTLLRRYVYGPGIDNPIALVDASGAKTYIHKDGLGSVIAVSNSSGTAIDKFTYDPFGNGASEANSPYKFAARRIDQETGLYYSRNRYYNPATGRFISADPIGYSDGMNMYAYVGNDPMNARDPWGLSADGLEEVIVTSKPTSKPKCGKSKLCKIIDTARSEGLMAQINPLFGLGCAAGDTLCLSREQALIAAYLNSRAQTAPIDEVVVKGTIILPTNSNFKDRMAEMFRAGHAGVGHALTYMEAIWWWRNAEGKTLTVDGRMLEPVSIPGGWMVSPISRLDDLKVHGHVSINSVNKRIYDGQYDFKPLVMANPNYNPIITLRNYLNKDAIKQHGPGTAFEIQYRYNDSYFEQGGS